MTNPTFRIISILLCVLVFTACKTTAPDNLSSGTLGGGMLGFEDDEPFWSDWTPRQPQPFEVSDQLQPTTVFDLWHIDDPRFIDPLWDVLFNMLGMLQGVDGADEAAEGLQYLQAHLDPQWNEVKVEIIFLSQAEANAEGILLRLAGSKGASLWIEAHRRARSTDNPEKWRILAEPATAEAPALAMEWLIEEGGEVSVENGPRSLPLSGPLWPELMNMLEEALWDEVSGRNYLEPNFEVHDGAEQLAPHWPPTVGQELRPREISDYVGDTKFLMGFGG